MLTGVSDITMDDTGTVVSFLKINIVHIDICRISFIIFKLILQLFA
jgi:hypothetical protein